MGAQMVREVASKTSDVAGDGTTTATVLAQAIFREGVKTVAAGANPMALKRGIDKAVERATEEIKRLSKPVKGRRDRPGRNCFSQWRLQPSATSLPKRWTRLAKTASSPLKSRRTMDTSLEVVEGMQFDRGYLSPYFVTDPETHGSSARESADSDSTKRRSAR